MKKFTNFTIVFTGLGGQGLIRLIQILGSSLIKTGFKVITSETHGLSQRGGKVTCFLRFGNDILAPIPMIKTANMIMAAEKSCVLDVMKYAKPDKTTLFIVSRYKNILKDMHYPSDEYILKSVNETSKNIHLVDVSKVAGIIVNDLRIANMKILGFMIRFLPLTPDQIIEVLKSHFTERILDLNINALKEGLSLLSM